MNRETFREKFHKLDNHRPLTKQGIVAFEKTAERAAEELAKKFPGSFKNVLLFYSPFVRTTQTANIVGIKFNLLGVPQPLLEHGKKTSSLIKFINNFSKKTPGSVLMLVGHEPELSQLFKELCSEKFPQFKKGEFRYMIKAPKDSQFQVHWKLLPL